MKFRYILIFSLILNFSIAKASFIDCENHWAKEYIDTLTTDLAITGYDDSTFKPNNPITKAEFLKVLIKEEDYKLVTIGNRWPDWYVNTAIKNNLISSGDVATINDPLKRGEAVSILANYIDVSNVSKSSCSLKDLSKANKENILKLIKLNVINGFEDNTFREDETLTRAQACKLIVNSYKIKNEITLKTKYKLTNLNSNIGTAKSDDCFSNLRYTISDNRIYITDNSRYGVLKNVTLNQEFVNDKKIISLLNVLADNDSYTAVIYVPDKYIINALNVCYGQREDYVSNGTYAFQIRFYENGLYNLQEATGIEKFSTQIESRIEINRMWNTSSEFQNEYRFNEKNLGKLTAAITSMTNSKVASELIEYIKTKTLEAYAIPNSDNDSVKIQEVKKIGNYTFNIYCDRDAKLDIYIQK